MLLVTAETLRCAVCLAVRLVGATSYYEIRLTGPNRRHYRRLCPLEDGAVDELAALGFDRPQIVVINGMVKSKAALFTDAERRKHVRSLGEAYLQSSPRSVAT